MKISATTSILCLLGVLVACSERDKTLPILGNVEIVDGDTVYHQIPDFSFIDQDSQIITPSVFEDKLYVADFFFTSCPSICPIVKKQMLRIYDRYAEDDRLLLLSHSIDTRRDSVPRLKMYAGNLGIESARWHMVTGVKDEIFKLANAYFVTALEDENAPGGYDHSGRLILVDKKKHVRAWCNGTDEKEVTRFMDEIDLLLDESY